MTEPVSQQSYPANTTKQNFAYGIVAFAGALLTAMGVFQVIEGIAAVANDEVFVGRTGGSWAFKFDLTAWGWWHIIFGVIAVLVGIGILAGQTWANIAGIVVAFLSAISNFAFLPYYPLWSIVIIAFAGLVIWALCTQLTDNRAT
jgi:hypothetical protein